MLQRAPSGWIFVILPSLSCDVQGKGKKNKRVLRGDEEAGTEEEEVQE